MQIGVSSVWYEGNPCNMHLLDLAAEVKAGVEDAGMVGYRFNTIGVSDAISMGTEGMSFSLQSRDIIADSVETVMGGQWYDGNISLPGCDKNMPGVLIAMGRLNRPSIMVYGGTIKPGQSTVDDESYDIVSAFQSYGMVHPIEPTCHAVQTVIPDFVKSCMASALEQATVHKCACPCNYHNQGHINVEVLKCIITVHHQILTCNCHYTCRSGWMLLQGMLL